MQQYLFLLYSGELTPYSLGSARLEVGIFSLNDLSTAAWPQDEVFLDQGD